MSWKSLAVVTLVGLPLVPTAHLQAQDFEWQGRVGPGQTIEVVGGAG